MEFKRVPALDKCFNILSLMASSKKPLALSEIASALNFNKSTVYNIIYTLVDLGILEIGEGKFSFGPRLYVMGKAAEKSSELIRTIHPYLEEVRDRTNLTVFLGMMSDTNVIILDKAESTRSLKISSEIGVRIPLLAGAHGKALLSQKSDEEIHQIISQKGLKQYTRYSCTDKEKYLALIKNVRKERISIEKEEYIDGIRALAVPLPINKLHLNMAIWAVGLKGQIPNNALREYSATLKDVVHKIEDRFSLQT
ncbi:MAG: IclR family transcriptional regulator [Deltaproteobacteria bacterium]|nr:IclR family transcriptional regulator [Deltaproteobacteria bacterium]